MDSEHYGGHKAAPRSWSDVNNSLGLGHRPTATKQTRTKSNRNPPQAKDESDRTNTIGGPFTYHGGGDAAAEAALSVKKKKKKKVKKNEPETNQHPTSVIGAGQSPGNLAHLHPPGGPARLSKDPAQASGAQAKAPGISFQQPGNAVRGAPGNPVQVAQGHFEPVSTSLDKTGASASAGKEGPVPHPQSQSDSFDESLYDSPDFDESSSEDESVGYQNGAQREEDVDEDDKYNDEGERIAPEDQMAKEDIHVLIKDDNPLKKFKEIADIQAKRLRLIPPPRGTLHRPLIDRIRDPVTSDEGPIPESIKDYVKSLSKLHACYSLSHRSFNKCSCLRKRRRKYSQKSKAYFKHQLEDQMKFVAKVPILNNSTYADYIEEGEAPTEDVSYYKYAQLDVMKASRLVYRFATSHQWDRHQFFMDLMVDAERHLEVVKQQFRPLPDKKYDLFRNRPQYSHPIGYPATFRNYRLPLGGPLKGSPKNAKEYPRDIFVCAQAVWNLLGVGMYHWMLARDRIKAGFTTPKEEQYLEGYEAEAPDIGPKVSSELNKISAKKRNVDGSIKPTGEEEVKRKPGRPRTHPIDPNNPPKPRRPRDPNAPKRPRGRPRKDENEQVGGAGLPLSRSRAPTAADVADVAARLAAGDVGAVKSATHNDEIEAPSTGISAGPSAVVGFITKESASHIARKKKTAPNSVTSQNKKKGDDKARAPASTGNVRDAAAQSSLNISGLTKKSEKSQMGSPNAPVTHRKGNSGTKKDVTSPGLTTKKAPASEVLAALKRRKKSAETAGQESSKAPVVHVKRTMDL